jgi:hypothetical protein
MRYVLGLRLFLLGVTVGCTGSVPANQPADAMPDAGVENGQTVSGKTVDYFTNLALGGTTLAPGVYCFNTTVGLTGALTLDAGGDKNAS